MRELACTFYVASPRILSLHSSCNVLRYLSLRSYGSNVLPSLLSAITLTLVLRGPIRLYPATTSPQQSHNATCRGVPGVDDTAHTTHTFSHTVQLYQLSERSS